MAKVDKKKEVKVLPILKLWLIVYNFMSCYGWGSVLYQLTDHLITSEGEYQGSYQLISQLLVVVQTCALLEVVHASVGLVKSSAFTTMVQVSSRLFIVWLILDQFPQKSVL
jgi:very-long-chain (3R)-3-hydroxyacyl-CoA dehydratase